jgi:hypothetical protein
VGERRADEIVVEVGGVPAAEVVAHPVRGAAVEHALQRDVRHRAEDVRGRAEPPQRLKGGGPGGRGPAPAAGYSHHLLAGQLRRDERLRRRGDDGGQHRRLVRGVGGPVAEGSTVAVRTLASTVTPRIRDSSMTTPPSQLLKPATLCPPPRTANRQPAVRTRFTAATMSSAAWHRAISAGRASTVPFHTARAAS